MTKLFTTAEAAARLSVTDRRVRQLCTEGRLGVKIGRQWLIRAAELAEYVPRAVGNPTFGTTPASS